MIRPLIPDPPSGYTLKEAVLTTFDLDMYTLRTLIGPDQDPEKFIVFRGDGEFSDAADTDHRSFCDTVVKVSWPSRNGLPEAFFHAKVWLFEFAGPAGTVRWHLIVHSANICPYDNLETELHFAGTDTGELQEETAPLCDLFQSLLPFIDDSVSSAGGKRNRLSDWIFRLASVRFTACPSPEGFLQQAAVSGTFSLIGPACRDIPFLQEPYDEILIISPFITSARLRTLADHAAAGGRCIVLTNFDTAGRFFDSLFPGVRWLLPHPQDPYIHAKIFLVRRGQRFDLYCGSMNLTDYAIDRNIEFMVHLDVSSSVPSMEAFLAGFTGRDETEITKQLAQYDTFTVTGDSPVFQQAADIQTRIGYIRHLRHRRKYSADQLIEAMSFLLSAECTHMLDRFLQGTDMPSIPLCKTIAAAGKKRDTYTLPFREMLALGLLNYTLHRYDRIFSQNVFLHIHGRRPSEVFKKIRNESGLSDLFLFRTDIHAFDPSMEADVLSAAIHRLFSFDKELCAFLDRFIYRKEYCLEPDGTVYTDGPAQMTGIPIAGFLENVYLQDYDVQMEQCAEFYVRCGDDILIGARTEVDLGKLIKETERIMNGKHLSLSETKTMVLRPGEPFVFMGWKVCGNTVDFSEESLQRIHQIIQEKTRTLLIRYKKAGIPPALRIPFLIRYVHRTVAVSGIRTSFRIVTVPDGLRKIDRMICDAIRTAVSGKTGSGKYRIPYKTIRSWGYRSLVSQYYQRLSR